MCGWCTLNTAYNEKKYAEILLCYRRLFVKGDAFIGEWSIFGTKVFLHYSRFFVKGGFVIGTVECMFVRVCVINFLFTLGLLLRMMSLRG